MCCQDYGPFVSFMDGHLPKHYLAFYRGSSNYMKARWGVRKVKRERERERERD
jgi:hypothetical protein